MRLSLRTLTFCKRSFGRSKNNCIVFNFSVPDPQNEFERQVQDYMKESISTTRMICMVPFIFENKTVETAAKHYLFHKTASPGAFISLAYAAYRFCNFIQKSPDQLINGCLDSNTSAEILKEIKQKIDEYIFALRKNNVSQNTICGYVSYLNSFFITNNVNLKLNFNLRKCSSIPIRAITFEEIGKMLDVCDLREKAIVSILATSGLRTSTLVRLCYRHVKEDLERKNSPVHISVEAEITKGKYHSYSTFINEEAAKYLTDYLDYRRKGTEFVAPEDIQDHSPLIKVWYHKGRVDSMSTKTIAKLIRSLYLRSKIVTRDSQKKLKRKELSPNSFRMFFRSRMTVLGTDDRLIEYMMGHKKDSYLDVKMAGVEYLRRVYKLSGISLNTPIDDRSMLLLKSIERLGYSPKEILKPDFLQNLSSALPNL